MTKTTKVKQKDIQHTQKGVKSKQKEPTKFRKTHTKTVVQPFSRKYLLYKLYHIAIPINLDIFTTLLEKA